MSTRRKAHLPLLINDSGVLVGYVDENNIERTLGGTPIIAGTTPPASIVIAQSAVPASVTGTLSETVLATIPIPAGAMGPNGSLRITCLFSCTNSADTKTVRAKLGGVTQLSMPVTTHLSAQGFCVVTNRNAANSQVSAAGGTFGTGGSGGNPAIASSVDTSQAQNVTITGTIGANAGANTITLESYLVEILNP